MLRLLLLAAAALAIAIALPATTGLLLAALALLADDQPLPESWRDHALSGTWSSYREYHLKPDLLLIYRKVDADTLRLARLGSHGELFG